MANVKIDGEAFIDGRYDRLARECGLADADHARGKMAKLWLQCTIERRYVLPIDDVEKVLGENAIAALTAARLGEQVDDGVRIRGTKGRIEWLEKLRKNGKKGGRPPKTKRKPSGFPEQNPLTPALALASSPAPTPPREGEKRAPVSGDVEARLLARRIWVAHCQKHQALRENLGSQCRPMYDHDTVNGFADLLERIKGYGGRLKDAEADCMHVLLFRESEARGSRDLQWFGHAVWREQQFKWALDREVGKSAKPATGEPLRVVRSLNGDGS